MKVEDILKNIERAQNQIQSYIHTTPLLFSNSFSKLFSRNIYLKAENLQKTGAFKVRGALYKILNSSSKFVSTASMGNHAQGVAYSAQCLGRKAKIVMPKNASLAKILATKGYGAEVELFGKDLSESMEYAKKIKDYTFIHPFDDIEIIIGQGTVGMEIVKECPNVTDVIVPVGGGGLIAGLSVYLKNRMPGVRIIGVQSDSAPSGVRSLKEKKILPISPAPTIADGIAVKSLGEIPFNLITRFVDEIVTVSEEAIAKAMLLFLERKKLVVEGAGAVGLAYLLEKGVEGLGENIVLLLSGGNVDLMIIDRIIHRGLISEGRMARFSVIVSDLTKDINKIVDMITEREGIILHIWEENFIEKLPFNYRKLVFTIETKGKEHLEELLKVIRSNGIDVKLFSS